MCALDMGFCFPDGEQGTQGTVWCRTTTRRRRCDGTRRTDAVAAAVVASTGDPSAQGADCIFSRPRSRSRGSRNSCRIGCKLSKDRWHVHTHTHTDRRIDTHTRTYTHTHTHTQTYRHAYTFGVGTHNNHQSINPTIHLRPSLHPSRRGPPQ